MTTSFSDRRRTSPTDHNLGGSERPHQLLSSDPTGSSAPKFKSTPPPSLPLSSHHPLPISPSYFSLPPGLSFAELLDSPVLLNSNSNILPSPTTGTFGFNWKISSGENHQNNVKEEDKSFSNFSFQTQQQPPIPSTAGFQSSNSIVQTGWAKQDDFASGMSMGMVKTEASSSMQSCNINNNNYQPQQVQTLSRRSDDGYNWRKYGQKQVKGSENPRSYYKCTYPKCPTKKKVERALDGQVTEIVYKGTHNHPKPQAPHRRNSLSSASDHVSTEIQYATHGSGQMDSVVTPENSSISMGGDDIEQSSMSKSGEEEHDEDEPHAKKWRMEGENEGMSAAGSRTVKESRVVVQTTSDIDILDDGYRWRKYGQKVVKGNPNPRSYYKCTNPGCPVRKHVERASHDLKAVITTYEGKHNHEVPPPRGSGGGSYSSINRPVQTNTTNNTATSVSSTMTLSTQHTNNTSSINNSLQGQAVFTSEILQSQGNIGFQGFGGNAIESYYMNMNQQQSEDAFSSGAKEEPVDDSFFESFLC